MFEEHHRNDAPDFVAVKHRDVCSVLYRWTAIPDNFLGVYRGLVVSRPRTLTEEEPSTPPLSFFNLISSYARV